IVRILNEFYEKKKEIDSFRPGSKSAIRHNPTWNKLERVWNDGHGIISFAVIAERDGKLLINSLFCSKQELKLIESDLKVPYELVKLGYPDYYNHGLESIREKRKLESSN